MSEASFIDSRTASLSGRLVVYNHPTEVFSTASIQLDQGEQGTFEGYVRVDIASAGWYKLDSSDGWLRLFCDTFLFAFGLYTIAMAFQALKQRHKLQIDLVRPPSTGINFLYLPPAARALPCCSQQDPLRTMQTV